MTYKKAYPKIDIYHMNIVPSDTDKDLQLTKKFTIEEGRISQVYYYGIEAMHLCDSQENCFELKKALDFKQINMEKIKKYLTSQNALDQMERYVMYDGGSTFYKNKAYSILFCNTIEGNHDIYIGSSDMVERLNGEYCGREKNIEKTFTRTYSIKSVIEDDDEDFVNVTLKQFQGEEAIVKINKSTNLVVGKIYEFTFLNFYSFEDTISNIFTYATLLKAKETDKVGLEQINDAIAINERSTSEHLSEIPSVSMQIKEGTLTNSGVTIVITDLGKNQYSYGEEFQVEKKEEGEWVPLEVIHKNACFNDIAYHVDVRGKLELELDWSYRYGELKKGEYRILKYALPNLDRAVIENDKKYFSVEFIVE